MQKITSIDSFDEDFEPVDVRDWLANLPPVSDEQRELNRQANEASSKQFDDDLANAGGNINLYMHNVMKDQYNKAAGTDNWEYRALPFMTEQYFEELMVILGRDSVKIMSGSSKNFQVNSDGTSTLTEPHQRADILISPEGMERLKVHNDNRARV